MCFCSTLQYMTACAQCSVLRVIVISVQDDTYERAQADAQIWAGPFLHASAVDILLLAARSAVKQQLAPTMPDSDFFQGLEQQGSSQLQAYVTSLNSSLPAPTSAKTLAPQLDRLVARPTVVMHSDKKEVEERALKPALELLKRYPALADTYKLECLILRSFSQLGLAFNF